MSRTEKRFATLRSSINAAHKALLELEHDRDTYSPNLERIIFERDLARAHAAESDQHNRTNIRAAYDEQKKLRAEIAALKQARSWQPIETAPRDRTPLLLWCGDIEPQVWVGFSDENDDGCWRLLDGERMEEPTHWMPLPNAPEKDTL